VPVAELLARSGAAAEINFHNNEPDPEFIAICIERGVKIAFGSDAHALHEVGAFYPHLSVLREAAGRQDIADLLLPKPPGKA
jgi:putative hydrolase